MAEPAVVDIMVCPQSAGIEVGTRIALRASWMTLTSESASPTEEEPQDSNDPHGGALAAGLFMSALWTPGSAGASPGFLRQSPAPPPRVHPLPAACAGSRRPWFDAGSALSLASSRSTPRGSGSTDHGLCVLHEGPTYPK